MHRHKTKPPHTADKCIYVVADGLRIYMPITNASTWIFLVCITLQRMRSQIVTCFRGTGAHAHQMANAAIRSWHTRYHPDDNEKTLKKKKRIILAKQKWIIFRHGICCFYWEQIRCEPFTHFFLIQFAKWKSKLIKCYFVRNEKKNSKPLFLFALIQQITNCVRQREGSCSVLNNFLGLPSFSSCERRLNCRTLCFESVFSLLL